MKHLAVGDRTVIDSVDPAKLYFPSGVLVDSEAEYAIEAKGSWRDAFVSCHANGWGIPIFGFRARVPMQKLFLLCGCIGENDHTAFAIGCGRHWIPNPDELTAADQQLYLFANDWPEVCFYNNNTIIESDPLSVTITRLR